MQANVYLVGAGPGDPGLISVRGRQCIERADVVIYDYLASASLLKHARRGAELIYVGKKGGNHTMGQEDINALIVEKARGGKVVTRLKGGDPYIFGRGGEEAEVLARAGLAFEVVPGVTSAIAAPAYAGIPLTHRRLTSTLAFITGHEDPARNESRIEWKSLAQGIGTLVFLMGVRNLPAIVERLVRHGKSPETPAALIRWGTTARQTTVTGTLENIVGRVERAGLTSPAVIVVGEVVRLRETLNWFEKRPLLGKRIVVTRAREQASDLVERLSELGAECLECPTIKIVPVEDAASVHQAIDRLSRYDWIVFTSVNGVGCFFEALFARGFDVRALSRMKTAAIGPATAERLLNFGLKSDIVPESYRAESVVAAFRDQPVAGKHILLPRAATARPILPVELRNMGAEVDEVAVYQTLIDSENATLLIDALESDQVDVITFTSSSTVGNFNAVLPAECRSALVEGITVACIGPVTAKTARRLGFEVNIVAAEFTIPGLCAAIVAHFHRPGN
jgi:uroporphyrinogen III methyltransferase/synthase